MVLIHAIGRRRRMHGCWQADAVPLLTVVIAVGVAVLFLLLICVALIHGPFRAQAAAPAAGPGFTELAVQAAPADWHGLFGAPSRYDAWVAAGAAPDAVGADLAPRASRLLFWDHTGQAFRATHIAAAPIRSTESFA